MTDIETLGVVTMNVITIGRQLTSGDSTGRIQRNCQCEIAVQIELRKLESCTTKGRIYKKCNADNRTKPSVILNLMGNNNCENSFHCLPINKDIISFFSEPIINKNQSFVSEKLREDGTVTTVQK